MLCMTAMLSGCHKETEAEEPQLTIKQDTSRNEDTTDIVMKFDYTEIYATLDHSETSQEFMEQLPLTIDMSRYNDREYCASVTPLSEKGNKIDDYKNGDVTYYTVGQSLAIFFGEADTANQSDLIRMGNITSNLNLFNDIQDHVTVTISVVEEEQMNQQELSKFSNVEITGIDVNVLDKEQYAVLYQQARYCQAMSDADIKTMSEMVAEDRIFTHMSGRQQSREEYFSDIKNEDLRYFTIGIENPSINVDGDYASIHYTSVLNADAYGARGTYRMEGTHWYEKKDGIWYSVDKPKG